ncbi:MAG: oligoendopeptidase F, partial [Chloroflexi bacterium]
MEDAGVKYLWDTTLLYPAPNSAELERDFSAAASGARQFRGKYFGKISDLDADGLKEALVEYEALEEVIVKPQLYAHLLFSADSGSDVNKALSQRAAEFGNLMSRELLFFDLEIMAIPDDVVAGFSGEAGLAGYRHYIALIRKSKPHILPEREER